MTKRVDVICGQMNLQKGMAGCTNLKEHLSAQLQTGNSQPTPQVGQINRASAFLMCLQEPPSKGKTVTGFGRDHLLFYDGTKERPRAAIYASRNLNL